MLEREDHMLLKEMFQDVVGNALAANNEVMEEKLGKRIDEAIAANNVVIGKRIDDAIASSESFLLDEIERFYNITKQGFKELKQEIRKLNEQYQTLRQEADTENILLRLYEKQQEEIDDIKRVIAM